MERSLRTSSKLALMIGLGTSTRMPLQDDILNPSFRMNAIKILNKVRVANIGESLNRCEMNELTVTGDRSQDDNSLF